MAKKDRNILKSYFETGDIPTEGQYSNLIDSFAILNSENTGSLDVKGDITATRFIGNGSLITGITSSLININSSTLAYSSGSLLISGNLYYSSGSTNVLLGIRTTGSILPGGNNIWDLGSPTQYFKSAYVNNIHTGDIVGSNVFFNNITSSGNISSSNNIIANNFTGIFNGALSSSAQIATNISGAFVLTSASIALNVASNLVNINTNTSAVSTLNSSGLLSSSNQIASNISGAFTSTSASISTRLTTAETELAGTLISSSAQINIEHLNSDQLSEGSSNLYYLDSRVKTKLNTEGVLSGSAQIATAITGAFTATSASIALNVASNLSNINTNTSAISTLNSSGLLSSSNQIDSNISGAFTLTSASIATNIASNLVNINTNTSAISTLNSSGLLSSSAQIASNISGAFTSTSASVALDIVNNAANTFKTTGQRNGNSGITGSLHLTGSTSDLRVDGTVGIGVAAPSAIESSPPLQTVLHVKSNHAGNDPAVLIEGVSAADNAALRLKNADEQWTLSNAGSSYSDAFLIRSESAVNGNSYPFMISKTATGPDQYHPLVHLNSTKLSVLAKFNDTTAANLLVSGNMTLLGPNGHITASGNISASGNINANQFTGIFNGALSSSAQITTNISGAFTATSASIALNVASNLSNINTNTSAISTLNSSGLLSSSAQIASNISGALSTTAIAALNGGYYSSSLQTLGNITSSGNISATGNISASGEVEGIGFITSGNSGFGGQVHVGGTTVSGFNTGQIFKATGTSEFTGDITGSSKLLIQRSNGQGNPDAGTSDIAIFQNNDNSQDASIAIIAADTHKSQLHFGKHDDIDVGGIKYLHQGNVSGPDKMIFRVSGSNVITFSNPTSLGSSRGAIGVGGDHNYPTDFFHAQGALSGKGLMLSSSNGVRLIIDRGANSSKGNLKFNTNQATDWTLGNDGESDNNFYIYNGSNNTKFIEFVSASNSTHIHTNVTASNNISASGNIYSTNVESTGTITAVSGAFSYITASIIDVDANTIRLGGSPFSKTDVDSLREGKMPEQTARAGFTNRLQPEAIFGKHDSDYIKFTTGHRIGTFINGTLFHDMNLTGSNNYFAVGKDNNTQLRLTGQITASSHISASGNLYSNEIESTGTITSKIGTGIFGIDNSEQPRVIIRGGHITASGDISSSGNISAGGTITSATSTITTRQYFGGFGGSNIHFAPAGSNLALVNGGLTTSEITASGNISASRIEGSVMVVAPTVTATVGVATNLIGSSTPNEGIYINSNITASGDISSSNASTASFGSMKLTNLPTTKPTTTGSLWLSGSNAEGTSKYLMVFTG